MSMQLNVLGKFTEKGLERKKKRKYSFEPDSNQRPKDYNVTTTVLRSTNWAIEGIDDFSVMNFLYRSGSAQKNVLLRIQRYFLFCLFVFWRTLGSRHAPKSSSEFFWSTKCELEIFYVFRGKTSERSTTGTGNEKQRTLRKSRRICPRLRMTLLEHTDFCGGKFSLKEKNSTFHFFFKVLL